MFKLNVIDDVKVPITFITDTLDNKAVNLLQAVIKGNQSKNIHLISSKFELPHLNQDSLIHHNVFNFNESNFDNLKDALIIFTSVAPLVWKIGLEKFCRLLRKLSRKNRLICCVHSDTISCDAIQSFIYISTCFVQILSHNNLEIDIKLLLKKSGKILEQQEQLIIDKNFVRSSIRRPEKSVTKSKITMDNLTTFNLGVDLTEKEKEAKENLILPYLQAKEPKIIYEPDEKDYEYEEDPDDDLEL